MATRQRDVIQLVASDSQLECTKLETIAALLRLCQECNSFAERFFRSLDADLD